LESRTSIPKLRAERFILKFFYSKNKKRHGSQFGIFINRAHERKPIIENYLSICS
jgi:hypothetical protein